MILRKEKRETHRALINLSDDLDDALKMFKKPLTGDITQQLKHRCQRVFKIQRDMITLLTTLELDR